MFTPAGNILFTYVLPGLPAFALLVAEAWQSTDDGKGNASLTLYLCAAAMPILILLGVLFVLPGIAPERSQKALVAQYVAQRTGDTERLVYLTETPQSAQFYARGKVTPHPLRQISIAISTMLGTISTHSRRGN